MNIAAISKHSAAYCIGLVVAIRLAYAAILYAALRTQGAFHAPFMGAVKLPFDWLYLFAGWDTGYYYSIAQHWYPASLSPVWAFFPLYPAAVRSLYLIGFDVPVAAFLVATATGLASIPLLLKVARKYLPAELAFKAALLYLLFPPVFVFSGVSYSEPEFLLLSLLTWHYHQRANDVGAALAASLVTLTRPYGILITLPLAYDFFRRREFRKLAYLGIPAVALASWATYAYARTGSLAMFSARVFWNSENALTFSNALSEFVRGRFDELQVLLSFLSRYFPIALAALASVLFFALLLVKVWKIDRALFSYSAASVLVIFYFNFIPGFGSFPRLLAFIFPIALAFGTRRNWLFYCTAIVFLVLSLVAWWGFLTDGFI